MSTSLHKNLQENEIHKPFGLGPYADATAREADTSLTTEDLRKFAYQEDDMSMWILDSIGPTVWSQVGPPGPPGTSAYTETLVFSDNTNYIIGPLADVPSQPDQSNLFVVNGPSQDYTKDFTIRFVSGGAFEGWYICISPTSTAPTGGSFSGGSNPGSGLDTVLELGDSVRVTYPL